MQILIPHLKEIYNKAFKDPRYIKKNSRNYRLADYDYFAGMWFHSNPWLILWLRHEFSSWFQIMSPYIFL